jgi:tetratricopeptide (TPR) repeat protein
VGSKHSLVDRDDRTNKARDGQDCAPAIALDCRAPSSGVVYEAKGDHDRAIADYGKAIELAPKLAAVYASRAVAYAKKGDKQHVIADLRKALALDPGNEKYKKVLSNLGETP